MTKHAVLISLSMQLAKASLGTILLIKCPGSSAESKIHACVHRLVLAEPANGGATSSLTAWIQTWSSLQKALPAATLWQVRGVGYMSINSTA